MAKDNGDKSGEQKPSDAPQSEGPVVNQDGQQQENPAAAAPEPERYDKSGPPI